MTPVLGIVASSNQQGRTTAVGSYDALATVIVTTAVSTITFAGIPNGYQHLQIRYNMRTANNYQFDFMTMSLNNDSSTSYRTHMFSGTGAAAQAEDLGLSSSFYGAGLAPGNTNTTNVFGAGIVDVLDYAKTNKFKTIRTLSGFNNNDSNSGRQMALSSGVYLKTDAVASITIGGNGGNLIANSSFALYGVK